MVKTCKQVQKWWCIKMCHIMILAQRYFHEKSYVEIFSLFYFSLFKLAIWILEMNNLRFYVWIKKKKINHFLCNYFTFIWWHSFVMLVVVHTHLVIGHENTSYSLCEFWKNQNKHFVSMGSDIVMVINVCNGYIS
jgi:hypothetical protein